MPNVFISLIVLLIFTNHISPRFRYIIETLSDLAGIKTFAITNNIDEYKQTEVASINYSYTPIKADELWIVPHGLLNQILGLELFILTT